MPNVTDDFAQPFPDYDGQVHDPTRPRKRSGKRKRTRAQERAKKKRQRARDPGRYREKMRLYMAHRRSQNGSTVDE